MTGQGHFPPAVPEGRRAADRAVVLRQAGPGRERPRRISGTTRQMRIPVKTSVVLAPSARCEGGFDSAPSAGEQRPLFPRLGWLHDEALGVTVCYPSRLMAQDAG